MPKWFSTYTKYYYDYSDDTSVIANYRQLGVYATSSANELFFYETPVDTSVRSWTGYFQIFGNGILNQKADGLYGHACSDCSVGPFCFPFDFLTIPAYPETGALIPQYKCAHGDAGSNEILNGDTVITVPAGTYHTFYLLHTNGDRSCWNRDVGMIMYEQYQYDRAFPFRRLATLKLHSMQ